MRLLPAVSLAAVALAVQGLPACRPSVGPDRPPLPDDTAADPDSSAPDTGSSADTGSPAETGSDTGDSVEVVPGSDSSAVFFGLDRVHTLDITVSEESLASLAATPAYSSGAYVPASIVFDGEAVDQVGIHLKGRWGSWRSISEKAGFKIDLNRYVPGRTLHGLEKLTLNNMIVDCSFNKEQVAWYVLEQLGVPASRTGYVWVTLNGADYGLYLHVESVDDRYLERNLSHDDQDASGNLYEADYEIWSDGSYTLVDFVDGQDDLFELKEGTDVGLADVYAVTGALAATSSGQPFQAVVDPLVDLDRHATLIAAEVWLGHIDGYSLNANNYYAWFDASDGLLLLPWDMDYAFIDEADWGFTWSWPTGTLTRLCLQDPTCAEAVRERLVEVMDRVEAMDLPARLDQGMVLTNDWILADPRQECAGRSIRSAQSALQSWFGSRRGHVEREWGL